MYDFALIGSPNTGKTTIFNALTKSKEKTGNYQGVTVKEKTAKIQKMDANLTDLPGIYLLSSYSLEEKVSENYINTHKNSVFLNIIESANFLRGVELTKSLILKGVRIILVLTFFDEFIKYGGKIDLVKLSKALKIPVIAINGENNKDIKRLKKIMSISDKLKANTDIDSLENIDYNNIFFPPQIKEKIIDKLLCNRFFCVFSFLSILLIIFCSTFMENSLGDYLSKLISKLLEFFYNIISAFLVEKKCPVVLNSFLCDGVMKGVFGVVSFLPQLGLLYLFISIMNESGYISRIAFMFDGFLAKIGLNGRAVFSYIMGLGCTAAAELSTRSFDNKKMQKKVALCLPFVSCSARLPIYIVILNYYFLRYKVLLLLAVYILGFAVSLFVSSLLNKFVYKEEQTFIMEIPNLRMPKFFKTLKILNNFIIEFIMKIGGIIIAVMCALWALKNFNIRFQFLNNDSIETSMIFYIGNLIKYIFYPIGITDWKISVSIVSGMFAKEAVVGSLLQFYPENLPFNSLQALSFLTFCGLYNPCLSALSIMRKEIGIKSTIILALFQFLLALAIAFIVNLLGIISLKVNIIIILFLLIAFTIILIKIIFGNKKCRKCDKCRKCYERIHTK